VVNVSSRLKDVVSSAAQLHGWNQPAGVNVNIANIPVPTEEEREEMRSITPNSTRSRRSYVTGSQRARTARSMLSLLSNAPLVKRSAFDE